MSAAKPDAICVRALTKRFGRARAVDAVQFAVAPGEAVVLWGPNGAGKTTILRCLLGIIPFEGAITVDGLDVRARGREARGHPSHPR